MDGGTVGLLTSLPVLCFGLATPPASALLARLGLGRGVLVALAVLLAGIVVRSLGGLPAALVGTVLIGAAITVANVAVPVVIGRELADRTGPVLGAYTAALNVGSMLTLSLTVPIADATGWQLALAVWGVLVVVAAADLVVGDAAAGATARPRLRPPSRSTRATAGGAARSCGASPSRSRGRRSPTTA